MGTAAEPEPSSTPRLPLFSIPTLQSTEPSGMQTPPLHTSASVPFRWEEEPGKPRPCTALTTLGDFTTRCLELPPRLLLDAKLPSPTAVEGPYVGKSRFLSARISREWYGSFSHERGQLGAITVCKRGLKERGWFGSWSRRAFKGKREVGGCSHVFPSSVDTLQSAEPSGMQTPPLHTSASVPFRWEEEPGKPRPCTALTTLGDFTTRCLELPPRLLLDAKLPSPTAVEGPYVGKSRFLSARISREWYGSFSHERGQLGAITVSKRGLKERDWFGSWSRRAFKGKREVGGCSHVFPSSMDRESDSGNAGKSSKPKVKMTRIQRTGSLSSHSHSHSRSHLWATIYEGLKQVVPWGSRKLKKEGLLNSELTLNQYS